MALFKLNAQVKIGPEFPAITDITDFIISIRRDYSICDFSQRFTLEVEPILWRNLVAAGVQLNPGTCIEIYEYGVKVLTGFFSKITRARKPANTDTLEGQDKYKLAMDFFNENETESAHGETIAYWSENLLTRCGLNFILDTEKIGLRTVPIGTEFGFRTIHECLVTLAAYAAGYYYVDAAGNVRLSKGRAPGVPDIRIVGGSVPEEYIIIPSDLYSIMSGGTIFGGYNTTDDNLTRNRAIVWGWYGPDYILASGQSSFIKADVISDNISLPVTRTVLYASPAIQDQNTAWTLARDIMNQLSNFTDIVAWDVQGNPDFRIGGRIYHNNNFSSSGVFTGTPYIRLATTVNSQMDKDGYTSHVRVGERCPRFAGWTSTTNLNRSVWIIGNATFTSDPVPQKLIWTGDLSGFGEPTFNLVQNIPQGVIRGMEVARDNSVIFLHTMTDGSLGGKVNWLYWADCQEVMDGNGVWTEILHSSNGTNYDGTSIGSGVVDTDRFNVQPIASMQCIGKTLYVGIRVYDPLAGVMGSYYLKWVDGNITLTDLPSPHDLGVIVTKNGAIRRTGTGNLSLLFSLVGEPPINFFEAWGFDGTSVMNGVHPVSNFICPAMWTNELNDGYFTFICQSDVSGFNMRRNNTAVLTQVSAPELDAKYALKGDYYGNQIQYVTGIYPGGSGDLRIAPDGVSFATTLTWKDGMCICISDLDPTQLYWIGTGIAESNEVGRFSADGGQSFVPNLGTGNWWGTNAEVLAGTKIQAGGVWNLLNIHPTFEVSIL